MRRRRTAEPVIWPLERVERMAHILGPASAARLALNEHARRTEAGESVVILEAGSMWLVGPDPASLPSPYEDTRR